MPRANAGALAGSARSRKARRRLAADHVLERGTVAVAEPAGLTGVSVMTVHRDLDAPARHGVLRRFRGGVSALPLRVLESSLEYRLGVRTAQKTEKAQKAQKAQKEAAARVVAGTAPLTVLTVLTNARRVVDVFAGHGEVRLIALGGEYSRTHDSYLGVPCVEAVRALSADLALVSTSALDGLMTYHHEQEIVLVKRAMLGSGARTVLLMDHSKMPRTALHRLWPRARLRPHGGRAYGHETPRRTAEADRCAGGRRGAPER